MTLSPSKVVERLARAAAIATGGVALVTMSSPYRSDLNSLLNSELAISLPAGCALREPASPVDDRAPADRAAGAGEHAGISPPQVGERPSPPPSSPAPASVPIHDIQGSGTTSPHAGQIVTTAGIVTGIKGGGSGGFFIQTPDTDIDADPNTSEGILVFTGASLPEDAEIGSFLSVTGMVQEFVPSRDPSSPPRTEIDGALRLSILSSHNPLPRPITLTAADTSPRGSLEQLEKFEGMRVHVGSLTVIGPTQGNVNSERATATSDGVFYAVISGLARPFREPGIEARYPLPAGAPPGVPRFDANPERLRVDSDAQPGAAPMDVTAGATISGILGPLDYSFRTYTILLDASAKPTSSGNLRAVPVPAPSAAEFTVASVNMNLFYDAKDDPTARDVILTAAAFNQRLDKASLAIRAVLRAPDILGVQEVENLPTLRLMANKINRHAVAAGAPNPNYQPYLIEGNDLGGLDVGFLIKRSRVTVDRVTQAGKDATYINPKHGGPELLNDRPPLILAAKVRSPSGRHFPVTVIASHLRSLTGVGGPDGDRIRIKRRAQAEFLADLLQARQAAEPDEHIIAVGDYNAFQFNDGYVDVIGTLKGTPAPASEVTLPSADRVDPDLVNLIERAPENERYSFIFDGSAQALDHILVTRNMQPHVAALNFARSNADYPEIYRSDPARPERVTDHDMPVAFFRFSTTGRSLAPATAGAGNR